MDSLNVIEGVYISEDYKELLNIPDSSKLPYHLMNSTSSDYKVLSHILMSANKENNKIQGDVVSDLYEPFKNFFFKICSINNIIVKNVFRAAINLTYHYKDLYGEIHTDHGFNHNNFIFCFNEFNAGSTYLFSKDKVILTEIKQFKNKYIFFPGLQHAQGFCLPGQRRIILVITFE